MLGFGPFGRIWVKTGPKGDEALRMGPGGRTYGQNPPVFYRTSSPLGPLPKKAVSPGIADRGKREKQEDGITASDNGAKTPYLSSNSPKKQNTKEEEREREM